MRLRAFYLFLLSGLRSISSRLFCLFCDQFTFCCSGLRSIYLLLSGLRSIFLLLFRFAINLPYFVVQVCDQFLHVYRPGRPDWRPADPSEGGAETHRRRSARHPEILQGERRIPVLLTPWPRVRNRFFPDPGSPTHIFESLLTTGVVAPVIQRSSRVSAVYPCLRIRESVPFLTPGSGMDFFRISDPQPIFLGAYWIDFFRISDSGSPNYIFESLMTIFGGKSTLAKKNYVPVLFEYNK